MKKRPLILRIIVIANALLVTAVFVGCPARRDSSIVTIAPPTLATIAPYGGVPYYPPPDQTPPPASQDSRNDKRSP